MAICIVASFSIWHIINNVEINGLIFISLLLGLAIFVCMSTALLISLFSAEPKKALKKILYFISLVVPV
jgi:hypothetical protein